MIMDADETLAEVDESLKQLRSLSNAVDERLRQRAAQPPLVLPSQAFLAKLAAQQAIAAQSAAAVGRYGSPNFKAIDPLAALTGVASALQREHGPQGLGKIPPYASAVAAAASVAKFSSSGAAANVGRARLQPSQGPVRDDVASVPSPQRPPHTAHSSSTQAAAAPTTLPSPHHARGPGAIGDSVLASGGTVQQGSRLALPGQLEYRELLGVAQASRAHDASVLKQELEGMDDEIDAYLAAERFERLVPDAAVAIQTAWRARGPRLLFNRYMEQRARAQVQTLAVFFAPLRQLVSALRHQRRRLLLRCFQEWREVGELKLELYRKVLAKLKASMIDIRDSQSPNHLWRLCTAPGEGPWQANISLGALCKNLIQSQAPRRKMGLYFGAWRERVMGMRARRALAVGVLLRMEASRVRQFLHMLFRFWYRWAIVRVAERLKIAPPLFRPRIPEWDAWLWEHGRSCELGRRVEQLHRGFRVRYCFRFWRFFTERNRKMRLAWISAAAEQIEQVMRYSLHCLMANWQEAKSRRRVRANVFDAWRQVTQRNILVRTISREVEAVTRASIKRQVVRQMREWAGASRMLNMSATLQILQRRTLCMVPMFAWTGDLAHMWFVAVWNAWRNLAVGRLRFSALLGSHMQRMGALSIELAFKGWRKAATASRLWREGVTARNTERAVRRQARADALRAALASGGSATPVSRLTSHGSHLSASAATASRTGTPIGMALSTAASFRASIRARAASGEGQGGAGQEEQEEEGQEWEEEEEDEDPELPDESVNVVAGDYALPVPWRCVLSREVLLCGPQLGSVGISAARITRMVDDLSEVEGRFKPGYGNDKQLVLDMVPRQEITEFQRQWADRSRPPSSIWQEQPGPDPWLWQRLVGLVACAVSSHMEQAAGPMVDHASMPWAEEVGGLRKRVLTERLRWAVARDGHHHVKGGGDPAVHRSPRLKGLGGWHSSTPAAEMVGHDLSHGSQVDGPHRLPAYVGLLPAEEQRELVWLWKLAVAEELLETAVAHTLGLGSKDLTSMYKVLELKAGKAGRWATGLGPHRWQGDLLTWLLRGPAACDANFMSASATYRANRDRVITMGMELHERAMALNRHCPEFTLTYPEYDPTTKRDDAVARVEREGEEGDGPQPLPEAHADEPAAGMLPEQQQQQASGAEAAAAPGAARHVGFSPPTLQIQLLQQPDQPQTPQAAGARTGATARMPKAAAAAPPAVQRSATMSKSELIKMEMLGQLASESSGRDAPVSPDRSATPPRSTPPTTAPDPAAAPPPEHPDSPDRPDTGTQEQPAGGRSLQAVQASGVVLGAAAAAILAARAAAARGGGGGGGSAAPSTRASTARTARLMAQTSERKFVWRPGGFKRGTAVNGIGVNPSGPPEARPPRVRRLPPLPDLRAKSPNSRKSPDIEDEHAALMVRPAASSEASAGAEQGAAALRAMLRAAQSVPSSTSPSPPRARGLAGLDELMATHRHHDEPPPPKPYLWFDGPGRIFQRVTDVDVPDMPPSMAELHHRADKLMGEKLNTAIFNLPIMPASMFSDWVPADGDDQGVHAAQHLEQTGPAAGSAGTEAPQVERVPSGPLPELSLAAPQEDEPGERAMRRLNTEASVAASMDAERKARLAALVPAIQLDDLLAAEAEPQQLDSYRAHLGTGAEQYIARKTVDLDIGRDLDGREGASHQEGSEDEGAAGSDSRAGTAEDARLAAQVRKRAARARRRAAAAAAEPQRSPRATDESSLGAASAWGSSLPPSQAAGDQLRRSSQGTGGSLGMLAFGMLAPREGWQRASATGQEACTTGSHAPRSARTTSAGSVGAGALEEAGGSEAGLDDGGVDVPEDVRQEVEEHLARPPVPHTFTVTAQQLNIFLGGKLRGYKGSVVVRGAHADEEDEGQEDAGEEGGAAAAATSAAQDAAAAEASAGELAAEGDFETVYDAGRVMRPVSARRRELLDGYNLRAELADLMSGTAPIALAGAEAALLGVRNLSAAEEEAVRFELERLEKELAATMQRRGRRGPRSPMNRSPSMHSPRSPEVLSPRREGHGSGSDSQSLSSPRSPRGLRTPLGGPVAAQAWGSHAGSPPTSQPQLGTFPSLVGLRWEVQQPVGDTASAPGTEPAEMTRALSASAQTAGSQGGAAALKEALEPWGDAAPVLQHASSASAAAPMGATSLQTRGSAILRSQSIQSAGPSRSVQRLPSNGQLARQASGASVSAAVTASPSPVPPPRPGSAHSVSSWAGANRVEQGSEFGFDVPAGVNRVTPPSPSGVVQLEPGRRSSQTADATLIFPDRPATGGSFMSAASSTAAAQALDDVYRTGLSSSDQGFVVNVYNSLANPAAGKLAGTEPELEGSPGLLFGGGRSGPGGRTRRKSNLRAAPPLFTPPLDPEPNMGTPSPAPAPLPPLPEGVDEESAAQLEALREMWASAPYSSSPADPDSEAALALSGMVAAAAEEEWRRYEAAAGRLVEELAAALSRKDAMDAATRPGGRFAASSAAGAVLGPAAGAAASEQQGATQSQFGRALSLMESNLAAAIDPDRLTGLSMHTYDDRLSDLMSRLMVAPMATRYLFWKKVQSVQQLRQRVMEDRVLEEQLRGIAWAATFQPGHAPPPSGLLPPRVAAAHAAARPVAAHTGAPPGMQLPVGWSAGAASVIAAPRVPWFTPLPAAGTAAQINTAAPPPWGRAVAPMVTRPMPLRPREMATRASPAPPLAASSTQQGHQQLEERPRSSSRATTPPAASTITPASRGCSQAGSGTEPQGQQLFPAKGTEVLAARLLVLLERRRWQREAEAASGLGAHGLTLEELDGREAEVGRLAALTIKLHKEQLDRRNPIAGTHKATLVPGKGHVVGWREPHRPLPPGSNGRDAHQDTTDPYTFPPRARPAGPPGGGLDVTLHGAAVPYVTAKRTDAEGIVRGLRGEGMSGTVQVAALPPEAAGLPLLEDMADHLPSPSGQSRPARAVLTAPLAPIVPTPQYTSALEQQGNIGFVAPHEFHYVTVGSRMADNAFQGTAPLTYGSSSARKGTAVTMQASGSQAQVQGSGFEVGQNVREQAQKGSEQVTARSDATADDELARPWTVGSTKPSTPTGGMSGLM